MALAYANTFYEHIELNNEGIPFIAGTNMKVVELVVGKITYGWSPEELYFQYPYLSMGQIHSALAYYWDNQKEIEQDIEQRLQRVQRIEQKLKPAPLVERLKTKGLI
jgi:uncharacterized protein (DUF433 family)